MGAKPGLNILKVGGILAKHSIPVPKRIKFGLKTVAYAFIGYALCSNAYGFLIINSKVI